MNEEIKKQLLEANSESKSEFLKLLTETEVGKSYILDISKTYWDENIKAHEKEIFDNLEDKIMNLGFKKQKGLETVDFLINIVKSNKELSNKLEAIGKDPEKNTKALQDLIDKKTEEIEQITKNYTKNIQEKDKIIQDLTEKQKFSYKSDELTQGIAKLNFSKGFSNAMIDDIIKLKKQELMNNATIEDEDKKIVWRDEKGLPIKGSNGVTNASVDEVLALKFKEYIDNNNPGGGAGTKAPVGAFNNQGVHIDMSNVKTRLDFLNEYEKVARANGLSKESDDYHNLYIDAKERYNIDNTLPEGQ